MSKATYTVRPNDFASFQWWVRHWTTEFSLRHYGIAFRQEFLPDDYSQVHIDEEGKTALFKLTTKFDSAHYEEFDVWRHALHEVAHLLTHRLCYLAHCRYVSWAELEHEDEALARRLENAIAAMATEFTEP